MSGSFRFKRPRDRDGGGWELSFADMMTLILCFFILVVTVSEIDREQYDKVAESLGQAMGKAQKEDKSVPEQWRDRLKSLGEVKMELATRVRDVQDAVALEMRPDAVAVNLRGPVFFELGSAELTPRALNVLDRLAPPLVGLPYRVTVEGHTDNIPITSEIFPSNWELSSARASAVARYLIGHGFPKTRIQVKGLADTRPTVPNLDANGEPLPENQARNRRIVILVEPLNK